MINFNRDKKMVNLVKFNRDKSVNITKAEIKRSIITLDKEGYIARNSAFVELYQDKLFGFIKQKPDKIQGVFIVREGSADPLEFKENGMYGKSVTADDIVYHEDENLSIASSNVELSNTSGPDYIQRGLVMALIIESVACLILVSAVGIPEFIKNIGGG